MKIWGTLPNRAIIHEVVLRDGLQNEKKNIPTDAKVSLASDLADCGIKRIEISSFVNPKLVPRMADAEALWERLDRKKGVVYSALVLSEKGLDRAIRCKVPHVSIFVSASETHSFRNGNRSISEAMKEALPLIEKAHGEGMKVRTGIMSAFGCVYEGEIPVSGILKQVRDFLETDPDEIALADTAGMGNPRQVSEILKRVMDGTGGTPVSVHFHNTRGLGMANVWAALNEGVTIFDASLGGLGGCPFIHGAKGNVATEDLVHMLQSVNIRTGIDLVKLIEASLGLERIFGKTFPASIPHIPKDRLMMPAASEAGRESRNPRNNLRAGRRRQQRPRRPRRIDTGLP